MNPRLIIVTIAFISSQAFAQTEPIECLVNHPKFVGGSIS